MTQGTADEQMDMTRQEFVEALELHSELHKADEITVALLTSSLALIAGYYAPDRAFIIIAVLVLWAIASGTWLAKRRALAKMGKGEARE